MDGHDHKQIRRAIQTAKMSTAQPTLIIGNTVMAKGTATREGDVTTHGAPLPEDEIAATKKKLGLPCDQTFCCPQEMLDYFRQDFDTKRMSVKTWKNAVNKRLAEDEEFREVWEQFHLDRSALKLEFPEFEPGTSVATRKAWGASLNKLALQLPTLMGGSADLDPSNQTEKFRQTWGNFSADNPTGRNLSFGVREFPMGAILNGMALHGGMIPFGATFLTFSDYVRNGIRMSAIQKLPVLYVFTHDSFFVGEDGPTHQPVEHLSALRLIPNLWVLRPADANETVACLDIAFKQTTRPMCLCLSRQGLPVLDPEEYPSSREGAYRGAYVLKDSEGEPDLIIIATGSEVHLALDVIPLLNGAKVRVVSMPCVGLFESQPQEYKDEVLPPTVRRRVTMEAGRSEYWHRYLGLDGLAIGVDHFGHSAPYKVLSEKYGFTPEAVAEQIRERYFNGE